MVSEDVLVEQLSESIKKVIWEQQSLPEKCQGA